MSNVNTDPYYYDSLTVEDEELYCMEIWPKPWIQFEKPVDHPLSCIPHSITETTPHLIDHQEKVKSTKPIKSSNKHLSLPQQKRFVCSHCETSFHRINDLKRHELRHRNQELTEGEYIQCTECPMKFTRCYSFRRHCHRKHSFLLSKANIQPMKSAMTELQLQIWQWSQNANTTIDPAVLMSTKKRRHHVSTSG